MVIKGNGSRDAEKDIGQGDAVGAFASTMIMWIAQIMENRVHITNSMIRANSDTTCEAYAFMCSTAALAMRIR